MEGVEFRDVHALKHRHADGLSFDPKVLHTGGNSGYQAINLAVLLGAKKILLLGYDMSKPNGRSHWHGDHPEGMNNPEDGHFKRWKEAFATILPDLEKAGVEVVNCTDGSELNCFRRASLESEI